MERQGNGHKPAKVERNPASHWCRWRRRKIEAIRAALKGGLIHVLITDERTGDALLK